MNILGRPHGTPRRADQEAQRKKKGKDIAHTLYEAQIVRVVQLVNMQSTC